MGTRSTVKFYNRNDRNILSLYNQYDGYYSGVATELIEFLESDKSKANGFEDMALLYVCYKKQGKPLHTYLTIEEDKQEFNYEIHDTKAGLRFKIIEEHFDKEQEKFVYYTVLAYASFDEFKAFVERKAKEEQDYWNSINA